MGQAHNNNPTPHNLQNDFNATNPPPPRRTTKIKTGTLTKIMSYNIHGGCHETAYYLLAFAHVSTLGATSTIASSQYAMKHICHETLYTKPSFRNTAFSACLSSFLLRPLSFRQLRQFCHSNVISPDVPTSLGIHSFNQLHLLD